MTVRTIVLLVVCLLSSVSLVTGADDPRASIIGTWRLISFKTQTADGTVTDLYGSAPLGQLIYDNAGHMSVHLLQPGLPKCNTLDRLKCPDREARAAFDHYLGYWGRFEVNSAQNVVTHHIEGASVPDWVGTSQQRFFKLEGDRLILTQRVKIAGVDAIPTIVWERQ
jgi:hypothetical protein